MPLLIETDVFTDMIAGGAMLNPPGALVGSYTNNSGGIQYIMPWIMVNGLDGNAIATLTGTYSYHDTAAAVFGGYGDDYTQNKIADLSGYIPASRMPIPVIDGATIEINLYSTNDLDQSADGEVRFIDNNSGIDVVSVAGAAPLSEPIGANVTQISGDTSAANNLEAMYNGTGYGNGFAPATQAAQDVMTSNISEIPKYALQTTVQAGGSSTEIPFNTNAQSTSDVYNGMTLFYPGGETSRLITAYNGSIRTATVSPAFAGALTGLSVQVLPSGYNDPAILRSTISGNTLNVSSSGLVDTSAGTTIPPRLR